MLKLLLISFMLLTFSGCKFLTMTGAEMRSAINECTDNNLTYEVYRNGFDYSIQSIKCAPLKSTTDKQ